MAVAEDHYTRTERDAAAFEARQHDWRDNDDLPSRSDFSDEEPRGGATYAPYTCAHCHLAISWQPGDLMFWRGKPWHKACRDLDPEFEGPGL